MLHNENDRLTYLTQRMIQDSCSIIGCNMQVICKQYGKIYNKRESLFNLRDFMITIKECDIQTVAMIRELQDAMQDNAVINVLRYCSDVCSGATCHKGNEISSGKHDYLSPFF